eukprot:CAMPEP_0201215114 /NCGR_PEP_ID=MMETSP0851-20130426/188780_1 /ASSEMBLY_ACC=CAM_ASM_000631 /TAXON_ID=183588 /ORGANISM="Pseudo-nitzschia fraudulenta, Strain WWA7" /LENGTH=165 /DNA_ID=CAMNT_0047504531 /DNA_START=599 /DNA_END=1096 /DNA_ORIENTATION=-
MVTNTNVGKGEPPDTLIADETPDAACTVRNDTQRNHQYSNAPSIDGDIDNHDKPTDTTGMNNNNNNDNDNNEDNDNGKDNDNHTISHAFKCQPPFHHPVKILIQVSISRHGGLIPRRILFRSWVIVSVHVTDSNTTFRNTTFRYNGRFQERDTGPRRESCGLISA